MLGKGEPYNLSKANLKIFKMEVRKYIFLDGDSEDDHTMHHGMQLIAIEVNAAGAVSMQRLKLISSAFMVIM